MNKLVAALAAAFFASAAQAQETPCYTVDQAVEATGGFIFERVVVEQGVQIDEVILIVNGQKQLLVGSFKDECAVSRPALMGTLDIPGIPQAHV